MKQFIHRRRWMVLGVAAVLAAGAGVGLAAGTIANDADVIQACAKQNSGALRIVETPGDCLPSEVAVSWNASGPAGTPGPAGPPGPSSAMSILGGGVPDLRPLGEPTTVVELAGLAPGAYAVTAKMRVFSNGGTGGVLCSLVAGRPDLFWNFIDGGDAYVDISPGKRPTSMVPFAGTVTLAGNLTSLAITCDRSPSGDPGQITIDSATIVAVKVGSEQHTWGW